MYSEKESDIKEWPWRTEEGFELKRGYNAVLMPRLETNRGTCAVPPLHRVALERLQTFLDEIESQGGEIVGIVPVETRQPFDQLVPPETMGKEIRQAFIIKKE